MSGRAIACLNLVVLALVLGSFLVGQQPVGPVMAGVGFGMALVLLVYREQQP
jgi:hypothetical protein